jgi:hypothetical protein
VPSSARHFRLNSAASARQCPRRNFRSESACRSCAGSLGAKC